MVKMVVLLCLVGTSPAECNPSVAVHKYLGPDYHNAAVCEFHRRWFPADRELRRDAARIHPSSFIKLICVSELVA